jgi:biopolymer transport protein ExbB
MEYFIYALLIVASVVGLTFIVERAFALRWGRIVPREIEAAVESCQSPEDVPMLRRVCQQHDAPLSRLLLLAADRLDWPKADNVDALQTRARHEIVRLERGLVVLEILVGIAPLLGLVGTIVGMMAVFSDVGQAGLADATKLAQGIALILRATLVVEMETLCDEFIRRQYREESTERSDEKPPMSPRKEQAVVAKGE